jgi:hypothetical protein
MMRRTPRPKPVREPEEVLLVDRVQHLDERPLKDLVLQRRDPERPQSPVRLWDEHPPRRPRPVTPRMDPVVQIAKVRFEISPVVRPPHAVHPRRGLPADRPVRRPQAIDIDMVQQRRQPRLPVRSRRSAHPPPVPPWALFTSFAGTTGPSDFPRSSITGLRPQPCPHDPPNHHHRRVTMGSPGSRA